MFLDDPEGVALGDDALECDVEMSRNDQESIRVCPDPLVLSERDGNVLGAAGTRAFARELGALAVRHRPLLGQLPDPLVHLAEERLVLDEAFLLLAEVPVHEPIMKKETVGVQ